MRISWTMYKLLHKNISLFGTNLGKPKIFILKDWRIGIPIFHTNRNRTKSQYIEGVYYVYRTITGTLVPHIVTGAQYVKYCSRCAKYDTLYPGVPACNLLQNGLLFSPKIPPLVPISPSPVLTWASCCGGRCWSGGGEHHTPAASNSLTSPHQLMYSK
jgi:hypothetical protein